MNGRFRSAVFWPALLTVAAPFSLAIGAQLFVAHEVDQSSLIRNQILVANGISGRINEIGRAAIAVTMWDEAVSKLDNAFDPVWAETNVGRYLAEVEEFEAAIVADRNDQPLYAMRLGSTVEPTSVVDFRAAAAPLFARVRAAERDRGPLTIGKQVSVPIFASATSRVSGRLYVLTASLLQPDFGTVLPRTVRSAIIITAEHIDRDFLESITDRFLLQDSRLIDGPAPVQRAQAFLRDAKGEVVGTLEWTPPQPGTDSLQKSLPITLLLITGLGGMAWQLYRRGHRITQSLIASEARAMHLASHDGLTGLANRALLFDRLSYALQRLRRNGQPFAVHCVDLDRFKEINDAFGHEVGDELLRAAAHVLSVASRQSDTLARLGADEFAIVQLDTRQCGAFAFAERIQQAMSEPIELSVGKILIGCSIGTTLVQEGELDSPECLRQADLALCRAKEAGRGCFAFFEPEMDAAVRMRRSLQADLRKALADDEIWLAYQPQVDAVGRIKGLEALVRWTHPERGPIPPAVFVPLAEESGLIDALGMKVICRAFIDSARFKDLKIAINISAAQLRMRSFVPRIVDLLSQMAVDPARFELEITEGMLLGDDLVTHQSLSRLRAIGFSIALDDFGTGYSSLSYLQRYPIDKIKIDRSFVANICGDDAAEAVVSAIVKLARALRLSVIAEGVETEGQRARLAAVGCAEVQGFLFGRPAGAEQIEQLLSSEQTAAIPALAKTVE